MKKNLLSLILIFPLLLQSQIQIGNDINGEASFDQSGYSVNLSLDGTILAIGARGNDGNGFGSGHVRIYENQSGNWVQLGNDIDGEAASDWSGHSVSLSSDGTIVAIGATFNNGNGSNSGHVRIYEHQSGNWVQIGNDIDGEASDDYSGHSVSLSSDGIIVAISAPQNDGNGSNSGHVRVYENQSGNWVQVGNDIDGEASGDFSGYSVSLSSDGTIVAIGAQQNDGNGNASGHVRIYENQSGNWVQIGNDIDGEASGDISGFSLSLSSDGTIVAIGAKTNNGNGSNSGHVRIYENQSGNWVQIGNDIDGEASDDYSGHSVSLSSDGTIVGVGAPQNDGNGSNSGHVRVYENQSGNWVQIGNDIDGEAVDDESGTSVSISSNGTIVAIGATGNDGNGNYSGHVRVYDLSALLSKESFKIDYFTIYPNPTKNIINIKLNKGIDFKKVNIYNSLGQFVTSTKNLIINTNNFNSGVYFLEVETNKGTSAKKIVIE